MKSEGDDQLLDKEMIIEGLVAELYEYLKAILFEYLKDNKLVDFIKEN